MAVGTAALLLLADSRLPSGAHVHSGGLEAAAWYQEDGYPVVKTVADLEGYLVGRLMVTGRVAAAFAAAACRVVGEASIAAPAATATDTAVYGAAIGAATMTATRTDIAAALTGLDTEYDVRTPSPAQRRASRAQGRSLLRAARTSWPGETLERVAAALPSGHHPVVLGASVGAIGGDPTQAATVTALAAVTGPASAAVRLLGLDPLAVQRLLADLAVRVDQVAAVAASEAEDAATGGWSALPVLSAPVLDILAEYQNTMEVRLFES